MQAPPQIGTANIKSDMNLQLAEKFLELVQKLKIPVVTAWNSNDELAFDSPYFVGMPGTLGTRSGNFAVQNCDLLLSLGCRLNLRMIGYNHFDFAKKAYKILVDIDKNELIKPTIKPDMTIHSDVKKLLQLCNSIEYIPNENHDKWRKWCKDLLKKYPAALPEYFNGGDAIINPYVFIDRLFDALNERYVNMIEVGIVDPTKVTRSALQNSSSIASVFLTTEAAVAEIPEKDDANAAVGGSMPGMM